MSRISPLFLSLTLFAATMIGCNNKVPDDGSGGNGGGGGGTSDTDTEPGEPPTDDTGSPGADDTGEGQPEPVDSDDDGFTEADGDCDDDDASIFPGADETCDGIDNDCDEEIDEDPVDGTEWFADVDGDGHGALDSSLWACDRPDGFLATASDCDDWNGLINPDADEICDSTDNDCDGQIDLEDDSLTDGLWMYEDIDGDGYGDPATAVQTCEVLEDYILDDTDCDDTSDEVYPGAADYCGDGIDGNCSGDETDCTVVSINEVHDMVTCEGTPRALRVTSDHYDISYNIHGLWNDRDTELGLRISHDDEDFVDVTYPGTPYAVTVYSHSYDDDGDGDFDVSFLADGGGGELDDLVPDCADTVSVGDVVGVIHEYTFDHKHVVKTELWREDSVLVRVWYEVTNIADFTIGFPVIQNYWDPDIADDVYGETDTAFTVGTSNRYITAFGPESNWTFSVGLCSTSGSVRGWNWPTAAAATDPETWQSPCNPNGMEADLLMGWLTGAFSLSPDATMADGFILTSSGGGWDALGAAALYASEGPGLCELDESEWLDGSMITTTCSPGISLPDIDLEL